MTYSLQLFSLAAVSKANAPVPQCQERLFGTRVFVRHAPCESVQMHLFKTNDGPSEEGRSSSSWDMATARSKK